MNRQMIARFLVLTLLVPLALSAQQQTIDPAAIRAFEEFVEREMKRDGMPGLSVAVLQGDTLWAKGFGFADLENSVPATEKSSYRMASVTKPMTAIAALRLAEMNVLDLDAEIQRYVPYFPQKTKPITVRQLLSHLGGISHYRNYRAEGFFREPKTTREAIAVFEDFDLVNEPGSAYLYSSYGYNLIGAAIEGATEKKYGQVMRELVWGPAGMGDTRMDSPTDIIPHRVTGYRLAGGELKKSDYVDMSSRFAAGGTRSTVVDMVRFAQAAAGGKLLRSDSLDRMWWPTATSAGRWITYGLGWDVYSVNGHFQVTHGGSQQETRTLLVYFPARKLGMAFASNFEEAQLSRYRNYLYWALTREIWNPPVYLPDPTDRVAALIADRLVDAGGLYVEKYGKPLTTDRRELQRAFGYVNNAFRKAMADPPAAEKLISDGMHPVSGQPLLVAGSWIMAEVLRDANGDELHRRGALSLLQGHAATRQLDSRLRRRMADLAREWNRVWTADQQRLFAERAPDEQLAAALGSLKGLRIAPSHVNRLRADAEQSFQRGDLEGAVAASKLASDVYPNDESAAGVHGVFLALTGEEAEGEKWLRRSVELSGAGYATPRRLASMARQIADMGQRDRAAALVRVARRVHPQSEELAKWQN